MGDNPGGLLSATSKATSDGTPVSEHFDQHGRRITTLGRDVNPFQIDARTLDLMSKSVKTGHAFQVKLVEDGVTTKGYNTVDSLLPAELMPGVVERIHEPRIADLLPTVTSSTLNYEYISDNTTSNPSPVLLLRALLLPMRYCRLVRPLWPRRRLSARSGPRMRRWLTGLACWVT